MEKNSKLKCKKCLKKILLWFLVFVWMILVFTFSNESGDTSSNTSGNIIRYIINIFCDEIDNEKIEILVENLQTLVRKSAHFSLYFIGGVLSYVAFLFTYDNKELNDKKKIKNINKNKTEIFSIVFCFIYAITDEIHQYFIPDRAAKITDVAIDTLGAFFAIVLCKLTSYLLENKKI